MKRVIRLGIAGCGEVAAEKHMPALAEVPGISVEAVADTDSARVDYVKRRHGVKHRYANLQQLLAHDGLDAIAMCLPPSLQADSAIASIEAGKHVWIDPPIALSLGDCDRVIQCAAECNRVAMAGFHMRWHRLVRQARGVIASGRLGKLQTIRGVWNSPRNEDRLHEWRRYRATGGGALVEVAMDHFDLWRYLLSDEILDIQALALQGRWEDESAVVSGRMNSGILFSAVFSERAGHDIEIEVAGKEGRLRLSLVRFEGLEFYPTAMMPSSGRARVGRLAHFARELPRAIPGMRKAGDYRASYRDQWKHFYDCIVDGASPASTLDDAKRALAVTLAAEGSTATLSVTPI